MCQTTNSDHPDVYALDAKYDRHTKGEQALSIGQGLLALGMLTQHKLTQTFTLMESSMTNTSFGELRSLLNKPVLNQTHRQQLWELIQHTHSTSPDIFEEQWVPYLETSAQHWHEPLCEVTSFDTLCQVVELLPFALFTYEISDEDMPFEWSDEWAEHFQHEAMSRVHTLRWRRKNALTYIEDLFESTMLTNLRSLSLVSQALYVDILEEFVKTDLAAQIHSLDLALNDLNNGEYEVMFSKESKLRHLKHLDIAQTGVTAYELETLTTTPLLAGLERLDLCDNEIEAEGAILLANSPVLQLISLDVEEGQITDEGITAIANSPIMSNLETLNVSWNAIGDAGAMALAKSTTLKTLKSVSIASNDISSAGVIAIIRAPWVEGMETLWLDNLPVDDEVAHAIAKTPALEGVDVSFDVDEMTDVGFRVLAETPHLEDSLNQWFAEKLK